MYGASAVANFTAAMASPAVGVARGFLRVFEDRLRSKVGGTDQQAMDGLTVNMARYAAAVAQLDAVHAAIVLNTRQLACLPVQQLRQADSLRARRDRAFAAQSARKTVNSLYEEGGGSGLFESSDLQRYWRDVNAAAAHHGLTWDWMAVSWTKASLGMDTGPAWRFTR
jgi:3-hydroxy-9,10-secoandrosta-1,3,5(10)-triene-9,17-dione monooxygenase